MTEPTKAEIMLDSVTKSNRLINYLRFCKEHPIPPLRLDLRPSTKVSIKAYQDGVQNYIDRLTAQNEKVVSLVKQIPDGEVQLVLQLRYGLLDNAIKKMAWYDMPPLMWLLKPVLKSSSPSMGEPRNIPTAGFPPSTPPTKKSC